MFICSGNMLGDGNANMFINFVEAAYNMPVNKAQLTSQELLVPTDG
ncbi:hypothetical protein ACN6AT_38285 (plasmid) [Streptomyces sp. JL4002]